MSMSEVDLVCPRCARKIALTGKVSKYSFMTCMGNGDFIAVDCPNCGMRFYILETEYDNLRGESIAYRGLFKNWLSEQVKWEGLLRNE